MSKSDKNSVKMVFSALSILIISLLPACGIGESPANKSIKIDGSSTVYPITQAVAEKFKSSQPGTAEVSVKFSGTSGDFGNSAKEKLILVMPLDRFKPMRCPCVIAMA